MKVFALAVLLLSTSASHVIAQQGCPDPIPEKPSGPQYLACLKEVHRLRAEIATLNRKLDQLANRAEASYGFTFQYSGSDILAGNARLERRVYFHATAEHNVHLDVYLRQKKPATVRLALALKVDGSQIARQLADSAERLEIPPDAFQHESLRKLKVAQAGGLPARSLPSLDEPPRPAGVHYIEFVTAAGFSIDEDNVLEVSGVVLVMRKQD